MLRLQLALLNAEPAFTRLRRQVEEIAGALSEKDSIPMVRAQMPLIQEVQADEFWQLRYRMAGAINAAHSRIQSIVRSREQSSSSWNRSSKLISNRGRMDTGLNAQCIKR